MLLFFMLLDLFAKTWLRIFASMFMRDIGLNFVLKSFSSFVSKVVLGLQMQMFIPFQFSGRVCIELVLLLYYFLIS